MAERIVSYNHTPDLGGSRVTNVGSPTQDTDAATKGYVSGVIHTRLHNIDSTSDHSINGLTGVLKISGSAIAGSATTADVGENTNLYYTDARARASLSENITGIDYNNSTGVFSLTSGYLIPQIPATSAGNYNYLIGVKAAATDWEYKSLSGTSNRVTVTHSTGGITLSGPQDLATSSSPTFSGLDLNNGIITKSNTVWTGLEKSTIMPLQNILAFSSLNSTYTVTASPAPQYGNIANMFDGNTGTHADWPASASPVTIQIDLDKRYNLNHVFGVGFYSSYYAIGIKIEVYNDYTSLWETVVDINNNNSDSYAIYSYRNYITKVKYTFSNFNSTDIYVSCLLDGNTMDRKGYYLYKGGDTMYGALNVLGNIYSNAKLAVGNTIGSYVAEITGTVRLNTSLSIAAGTASSASLILGAGTLSSSPLSGYIENDGTNLWYTDSATIRRLLNLNSITNEPTGFPNTTESTISFTSSGRVFTIAPTGTTFRVYLAGRLFNKTTETVSFTDTNGIWIIYYTSTGVLTASQNFPAFDSNAIVATIYWNGTDGILGEERHGVTMDWVTHQYLHSTVGTRYATGLEGTFSSTPNFSITAGSYYDEDLKHTISSTQTQCRVFYVNAAVMTFTAAQTTPYVKVSNIIQFNSAGTLANVTNNKYVAYWVFATNHIATPIMILMGQREDTTLAAAQANNTYASLVFSSLPTAEMKLIYRVIYQRNGTSETFIQADDYRTVSSLPGSNFTASAHNLLSGLDYTSSGHVGFASTSANSFVGNQTPSTDLTYTSGGSSYRWSTIYAGVDDANSLIVNSKNGSNYSIYQTDTDGLNYFGGKLLIKTLVDTGAAVSCAGSIYPSATNTYSLGSGSYRWDSGYYNYLNASYSPASGTSFTLCDHTISPASSNNSDYYHKIVDNVCNYYNITGGNSLLYVAGTANQVFPNNAVFAGTLKNQWATWNRYGINSGGGTITNAVACYNELRGEAGVITTAKGIYNYGGVGTCNITTLYGVHSVYEQYTANITSVYGMYSDIKSYSGATITNAYGVYINNATNSGTITNNYGIYATGCTKNYLAGELTVTGTLKVAAAIEIPVDPTPVTASGSMYIDTGANKLYVYYNSAWHYATLT